MYLADFHTHSRISPDSRASMVDMAQAAIDAGVQEICFTDHIEPNYWDGTLRDPSDWGNLLQEFAQVQATLGDQIKLRLGIELGDALLNLDHTQTILKQAPPFDFIIGSVHCLGSAYDHMDLSGFCPQTPEHAHKAIADYLIQVEKMCQWGQFHVLGHFTLPLRYFKLRHNMTLTFEPHRPKIIEIFKVMLANGIGLELNTTRGLFNCPDAAWLSLFHAMGGTCVTMGTDAHAPTHVGFGLTEGQALLKRCGYTQFSTFEKGMEVRHNL